MKHICILTNFRTGSTTFIQGVAHERQLMNCWEFFGDGLKPAVADVAGQPDQVKFTERAPRLFQSNGAVFKVMGNQLGWNLDYVKQIAEQCEMMYLYRRNFLEQAKSWTGWLVAQDWGHIYGKDKTYELDCTQQFFNDQADVLARNYEFMLDAFEIAPGKVHVYEDMFTDDSGRYNRKYDWPFKPVLNNPFDTTRLDDMSK